jgi:hypothetical protein
MTWKPRNLFDRGKFAIERSETSNRGFVAQNGTTEVRPLTLVVHQLTVLVQISWLYCLRTFSEKRKIQIVVDSLWIYFSRCSCYVILNFSQVAKISFKVSIYLMQLLFSRFFLLIIAKRRVKGIK